MTAILYLALLAALAPAKLEPTGPVTIGDGYALTSTVMADKRRINVLLPDDYADPAQSSRRYPVLYLLDGGGGFQDFANVAAMVQRGSRWGGGNKPMIVIGIESKDRKAEFTSPSSDPAERRDFPTSGSAERFRRFLVDELKPNVDATYRTDGTDALMGESLAGLFVVETMLREPRSFDLYVAISPSLWWDRSRLANDAPVLLKSHAKPSRLLWITVGNEGGAMKAGVDKIVAAVRAKPDSGVRARYVPLKDEGHGTIYQPAAMRALRSLFPDPTPNSK
ncbi:alpha/beta hydrolase [Sphingomonas jaspsi]|uniref:alpha/beta hydrolase n=1 Tax=Sphingomonas jaspsi TaxID=392409 RepID=UPI0004B84917|nr:alpha/beta hydrolase-fold protein [Sphingomonas jaspsi]